MSIASKLGFAAGIVPRLRPFYQSLWAAISAANVLAADGGVVVYLQDHASARHIVKPVKWARAWLKVSVTLTLCRRYRWQECHEERPNHDSR